MKQAALFTVALLAVAGFVPVTVSASVVETEAAACTPSRSILKSPRVGSREVQAKALNDRGDVVGFADGSDGTDRAILWKGGKVAPGGRSRGAARLRLLGGLRRSTTTASCSACSTTRRSARFRSVGRHGRMTVLKGPNGRIQQTDVPDRNAINERGEIAATLISRRPPARGALDAQGQGELPPGAAGTRLDECMGHRPARRRVWVVAKAAQR